MAYRTQDEEFLKFLEDNNKRVDKAMEGFERHSKSFDKRIKRILNAF